MRTVTTRTIAGRVNADGTIAATQGGFTVRRAGVGVYVLVTSGSRLVAVVGAPIPGGGVVTALTSSYAGDATTMNVYNTAGAATDGAFSFTATVQA